MVVVVMVVVVVIGGLLFDGLHHRPGDIGVDLGDISHGLGPPLPKHHPGVRTDVLWVLDEAETAAGLVSRPQVLSVHGDDGSGLTGTATMNYTAKTQTGSQLGRIQWNL